MLENFKIAENKKHILWALLATWIFSFVVFIPSYENPTTFEQSMAIWPTIFCTILSIVLLGLNFKQSTFRPTESLILIQLIASLYWLVAANSHFFFIYSTLALIGLALYQCISSKKTNNTIKILFSLCCSIVIILFAVVYIYKIMFLNDITFFSFQSETIKTAFEYFLFGSSVIYCANAICFIVAYLPAKTDTWTTYKTKVKEANQLNIDRYQEEQTNLLTLLIILGVWGGFFILNYQYNLLPPISAVWIAFFAMPWTLKFNN